jgi:N-acylneuraminate cytidylyltransferase
LFCGQPLIAWTITAALGSQEIDGVYVSTDCDEIAAVSRSFGADVVARPDEFASDTATVESALTHAVSVIETEQSSSMHLVIMLQATSPLRESAELDDAIGKLRQEELDSLFSAAFPDDMLIWQKRDDEYLSINYDWKSRQRRQDSEDSEQLLIETGSFYVTRRDLLMTTGNRLGGRIGVWQVPFWKSFEIDSQEGLELCQTLMQQHRLDTNSPAR